MHIPDGFLDLKTAGTAAVLSLSGLGIALRRLRLWMPRRKIPLMGITAAFVFTAQLLNFPVGGGTSGHLLGAVLASILLGPGAALVVMAAVLVVQCLLFSDGGLLALGANVFNMALVAVLSGNIVFKGISWLLPGQRGMLLAAAFASWFSTVLAAMVCAGELAWSGVASWGLVFPPMVNVHMVIGVGEGLITTLVIVAIQKTRPDLLESAQPTRSPPSYRWVIVVGMVVILGLLLLVLPFVSKLPDGLERVGETLGFASRAASPLVPAPMSGYQLPELGSATVATCIASFLGTLVVFALACALAVVLAPRSSTKNAPSHEA